MSALLLQDKIKAWAQGAGVQGDLAAICRDPKTNEFLLKDLTATGKEGKLKVGVWCDANFGVQCTDIIGGLGCCTISSKTWALPPGCIASLHQPREQVGAIQP